MPPLIETRAVLAPFVGQWLRCRGVAMRDAHSGAASSFVCRIDVWLDGGWAPAAGHAWVAGERLCRTWGRGVRLEFDAMVGSYRTDDPTTGEALTRYGLRRVCNVVPLGPAALLEFVGELVAVWGWEAVANAVEAAHGG